MSKQEIIKIFGDRKIRSVWDDEAEIWYFSIVDVVAVLTESADPANYWKVLKNRLKKERNETVTNCNQLKLRAADGKMRSRPLAAPCGPSGSLRSGNPTTSSRAHLVSA